MNKAPELSSDRIELVETFLRIVDAGKLSAAARRLGTTQPTVSRRLQMLESWLGVKLLQRTTHSMSLTEDGERFSVRARNLMEDWNALEEEVRGARTTPSGHLRVVVPHAFGQEQMIAPLADYMRSYPEVTIEWILHDLHPNFIADGIDCAVQLGVADDLNTVAIQLAEVPRIVVASPAFCGKAATSLSIDELHTLPWVALRQYYRDEAFLVNEQNAEERRIPLHTRLYTDSLYALRAAVLSGLGACLVSAWVVAEDLEKGRLVRLVPEWGAASLPVYIAYPYARYYPARLRAFVSLMRDRMPYLAGMRAPGKV
jgi:DNA-binding transcriptional LysR family regulator